MSANTYPIIFISNFQSDRIVAQSSNNSKKLILASSFVRFLILKAQVRWWLKTKYIHFTREIKFCEQNCISHFTRVVKLRFTARVKVARNFFRRKFCAQNFREM
ncbi:MAG: hypothetical protein DRR16_02790 [Candidatus Parabeggiatoa sp. nov. 3]|nr:MAG: hypothetical protein DRR00_05060 [Gammaproteobacteria bacterium]RKZ55507.1 MAG: hypothetical protein DRQ99_29880 [Gammaproteobacteria bacterium]RKZ89298.1 MAG: hypothetical protein DRR16_02790 [Gammaproteobacteria bacterium]